MDRTTTRARALEVTILSADDLRINNKPVKNNAFVILRTGTVSPAKQQYSTAIDTTGENYPIWNEKLHVELPHNAEHLDLEVRRRSSGGSELFIGAARIPVTDFIGDYAPEKYLHFLSYRLRDAQWQKNGIINVSVRVTSSPASLMTSSGVCSGVGALPEMGIPVVGLRVERRGTVTGVPVWSPYSCRSS